MHIAKYKYCQTEPPSTEKKGCLSLYLYQQSTNMPAAQYLATPLTGHYETSWDTYF